jgi:hypothetical protein
MNQQTRRALYWRKWLNKKRIQQVDSFEQWPSSLLLLRDLRTGLGAVTLPPAVRSVTLHTALDECTNEEQKRASTAASPVM